MTTYQPDPPHLVAKVRQLADSHPHPLLFTSTCGSKLYGFDTPRSDRDLHGAHIIPLDQLLGLEQPNPTIVRKHQDTPPVEISTHEIRKCFGLLLNRNANILEQILSPLTVTTTPEHVELQAIAGHCITRRHAGHYMGMAKQAMNLLLNKPDLEIKNALHMYRALLTGIHLMRTGRLEPYLPTLNLEFQLPRLDHLLHQRQDPAAPQTLTPQENHACIQHGRQLTHNLENAADHSGLPMEPTGKAALNDLLLRIRKQAI